MIICGEELEIFKLMDEILRIIGQRDNDRVLLSIMYQVQENGVD
jgi:hypothetical protein